MYYQVPGGGNDVLSMLQFTGGGDHVLSIPGGGDDVLSISRWR